MFSIMKYAITEHTCGRSTSAAQQNYRRMLCAAAFGSLSGSSWAFVAPQPSVVPSVVQRLHHAPQNYPMLSQIAVNHQQPTRLFFSQPKDDDNDWKTFKRAGGNLLKKGANKIKSLIPFSKSEEEKRAQIIKKERKAEIKGGINAMLKDMPLPIRMMGRMVGPLMARAAGEMAEQAAQAQDMLEEARMRLVNDPYLAEQLGDPLQVGQPFSQSSSTMVINGQRTANIKSSFQVAGPRGNGIATMISNNGEISSLNVNVNGRNLSIGSSTGRSIYGKPSGNKASGSGNKADNIIEAEIIEKK